ncbi:transposase [Streptomyces sp. NPDC051322]|uniref:IS701 family transposase n=1 Tax=Streptomyces sp. NPDC051322 TaxID=3154645 RepID=UPI00344C4569
MTHDYVTEFITETLASIPRSDQRRWGDLYVKGLLSAAGRKTMRALAQHVGGSSEQNLHQFISKSPWDCSPVRQQLARRFQERAEPRAWVVQPLIITKVGRHSVGVGKQFVPQLGRVVNCQQGMGIWLASDRLSCPVDWQLSLPECWTDEPDVRRRAAIPEHVGPCGPEQCALSAVSRMSVGWGLRQKPVVMDLRETDPRQVCVELIERRIPFVVRISPSASIDTVSPSALRRPGGAGDERSETRAALVSALRRQVLPVEWFDHSTGTMRATAVGSTRVQLRGRGRSAYRQPLVLLGSGTDPGDRGQSELWLSNLSQSQPGTLYRTAMLSRRVERDQAEVSDQLGLRDFEGRSFRGWHHHMTLVSLAHAVTALSTTPPTVVPPAAGDPLSAFGTRSLEAPAA